MSALIFKWKKYFQNVWRLMENFNSDVLFSFYFPSLEKRRSRFYFYTPTAPGSTSKYYSAVMVSFPQNELLLQGRTANSERAGNIKTLHSHMTAKMVHDTVMFLFYFTLSPSSLSSSWAELGGEGVADLLPGGEGELWVAELPFSPSWGWLIVDKWFCWLMPDWLLGPSAASIGCWLLVKRVSEFTICCIWTKEARHNDREQLDLYLSAAHFNLLIWPLFSFKKQHKELRLRIISFILLSTVC